MLYAIGSHQTFSTTCSTVALTVMSHCRRRMVNSGQVQWLGRLAADFPLRTPGFHSTLVHMGFMVNKVALKQVFSPGISVFPYQYHTKVPYSSINLVQTCRN